MRTTGGFFKRHGKAANIGVQYAVSGDCLADRIGLRLYDPTEGASLMIEMRREEARRLGEMLIRMADQCDKGRQDA